MAAGTRSWNRLPWCGTMAVIPVCTESPWITVTWPTRTPGTSVIAFNWPGESVPGVSPSSRARTFCCAAEPAAVQQTRRTPHRPRNETGMSGCGRGCKHGFQTIEQLALSRVHFFPGQSRGKPGTAVHFGEGEPAAGATRPFGLHRTAADQLRIGVALPGPGMHHLSCFLANSAEWGEGTLRVHTGFLFKLPAGGGEQILARL